MAKKKASAKASRKLFKKPMVKKKPSVKKRVMKMIVGEARTNNAGCCIINVNGNINKIPGIAEGDCREMAEEFDVATWRWVAGPCKP
jgi:hypothetical protein